MKKSFLIFIIFVSFFYLSSENVNAATRNACEVCSSSSDLGYNPSLDCKSYYASGNICYSGISCQNGNLLNPYKYCLSVGLPNTPPPAPSDSNKLYCQSDPVFLDGYVIQDISDPRTDTQCQDKTCGSSGWTPSNKLDGTQCTGGSCFSGHCCPSGQTWNPLRGECESPICTCAADGTPCNSCSASNSGKRCVEDPVTHIGNLQSDPSCNIQCTTCTDGTTARECSSHNSGMKCVQSGTTCSLQCSATTGCGTCPPPPEDCSGYNTYSSCQNNGCKWCGILSPSCVTSDTYCPSSNAFNCQSQTSESACGSGTCAWCSNTVSGQTNPNGGICMNAQDLAGQCGPGCRDGCASSDSDYDIIVPTEEANEE